MGCHYQHNPVGIEESWPIKSIIFKVNRAVSSSSGPIPYFVTSLSVTLCWQKHWSLMEHQILLIQLNLQNSDKKWGKYKSIYGISNMIGIEKTQSNHTAEHCSALKKEIPSHVTTWGHDAECNKLDTEGQVLYDSIHRGYLPSSKSWKQKQGLVARVWGGEWGAVP